MHSWIFKNLFFEQLVSSGELICAMVKNFSKIGQTVLDYRDFLIFKMIAIHHLGFRNF